MGSGPWGPPISVGAALAYTMATFTTTRVGTWSGQIDSDELANAGRLLAVACALVAALFSPAAAMGKHVMIGGIDANNEPSLRLHDTLGFERVAHFKEVGHKFDRWLDLVFVQKFIDRR